MKTTKTELRSIIKTEMEEVFGRRIVSSRDCIELSDEIYEKTGERLNQNTLRRFFGLVKSEYPPSHSTLSILSKYCGFQTLDDAYKIKSKNPEAETTVNTESVLHYLTAMFKDLNVKNLHDKNILDLVKHTVRFVNTNEGLAEKFYTQFVRTNNGCRIYFENLINVDNLNGYYGNTLRYYLREKGTVEAEIFTNSLLAIRSWLNGDEDSLEHSAFYLLNQKNVQLGNPVMYAKYFSALVFYNKAFNLSNSSVKRKIDEYYESMEKQNVAKEDLYSFCYHITEAFVLTHNFEEALQFIDKAPKLAIDENTDHSIYHNQNMLLMHSYLMYKLGAENKAEKLLNSIRPSEFHFMQKKFCNIFYLYLLKEMKHNGKKYGEQLMNLIDETGFLQLKKLVN